MRLIDKMRKFKTVKRGNCPRCGNPWWFDRPKDFECTTCAGFLRKDHAVDRSAIIELNNDVGGIVKYKGKRPEFRQKERGIFTDDTPRTEVAWDPSVTEIISDVVDSVSSSPSSDGWSGGGGDFNGGGASGDW